MSFDQLIAQEPEVARAHEALLARVEEVGQLGTWAWNAHTGEVAWSENMFRLLGLKPGEIVPTVQYVLGTVHPDDRERMEHRTADLDGTTVAPECWWRVVLPDGELRHLETTTAVVGKGTDGSPVFIGCVRDVTDHRRAEREIAAHVATVDALSRWESLELGGERLLRGLASAMQFERGLMWTPRDGVLVPRIAWRVEGASDVLEQVREIRLAPGVGIAGRAWATRKPVAMDDVNDERGYQFRAQALREGLRGALSLPAVDGDDVLAVLSFASREEVTLTERLMRSMVGIGHEIGDFLAHRRADLEGPGLTRRQIDVLQLAAHGHSVQEIAEHLGVSAATVKTHFENIYQRYAVSDRASAVAKGLRNGAIK